PERGEEERPEHRGRARRVTAAVEVAVGVKARDLLRVRHVDVRVVEREAERRPDGELAAEIQAGDRQRGCNRDRVRPPNPHLQGDPTAAPATATSIRGGWDWGASGRSRRPSPAGRDG